MVGEWGMAVRRGLSPCPVETASSALMLSGTRLLFQEICERVTVAPVRAGDWLVLIRFGSKFQHLWNWVQLGCSSPAPAVSVQPALILLVAPALLFAQELFDSVLHFSDKWLLNKTLC